MQGNPNRIKYMIKYIFTRDVQFHTAQYNQDTDISDVDGPIT